MQSFKVFDIIYATTAGGPGLETTVLNFHIYKVGMIFFDMGYASALANILLFMVVILAVIYVMVLERQQLLSTGQIMHKKSKIEIIALGILYSCWFLHFL